MTTSTHTSYAYVSFSRPETGLRAQELVDAQRNWRATRGQIIEGFDYRHFCDSQLAQLRSRISPGTDVGSGGAAEQVMEILASDWCRKGPRKYLTDHWHEFTSRVESAISSGEPVRILIPSFPARPCNPITHLRVSPDLGEAASFVRLHAVAAQVREVYPPGVRFTLVLDGRAYAPFYGYTPEASHQYPDDLKALGAALGVANDIDFVDLQDLVDLRSAEFVALHASVEKELREVWAQPVYEFRDELVRSMRLGTNSAAAHAALALVLKYPETGGHGATFDDLRQAVEESARHTAFSYMCFLVTIRRMALLDDAFPGAIRGTVHPKPGQYSPRLMGDGTKIVPWHGVAVWRPNNEVDSVYEAEILRAPERYTAVFLRGQYTPLFYRDT